MFRLTISVSVDSLFIPCPLFLGLSSFPPPFPPFFLSLLRLGRGRGFSFFPNVWFFFFFGLQVSLIYRVCYGVVVRVAVPMFVEPGLEVSRRTLLSLGELREVNDRRSRGKDKDLPN